MKKIIYYIPFQLSILLVLGILLGYYYLLNIDLLWIALFVVLLLLWFVYLKNSIKNKLHIVFKALAYILVTLIGILAIKIQLPSQQKFHYTHYAQPQSSIIFQISKELKYNGYQHRFYAEVIAIDKHKVTGSILVNYANDSLHNSLSIGNTFWTKTTLTPINTSLNPHTFNYREYLNTKGIQHQIYINKTTLKAIAFTSSSLLIQAYNWRNKLEKSLDQYFFSKDEMAVIKALILGQRQDISKELAQSYAGAGAIHILAVSGLHIGILFMILSFLLQPLEQFHKGKHLKAIVIVILLWGFALLTGLSGSVTRAVTMFTFIAIGMAVQNQKSPILHALFASFFFLLLIRPMFIFDVGFQMSYAAVLGIVLLQPKIMVLLPHIRSWLLRKIWILLSVSIAATIGTLPLSLYYFHQFPSLFFLSNVVIVPFIGLIMGIGILVVVLAVLHILPEILVQAYSSILWAMNFFIDWVAQQEQFLFKEIHFSFFMLLASYLIILTGYSLWEQRKITRLYTFLLAIILFQSVFLFEKNQTNHSDELVIFHKSRETLLGLKQGKKMIVLHSLDSLETTNISFIKTYKTYHNIDEIKLLKTIPNQLKYQDKTILIIDSLGIYHNIDIHPDIVLLRQSPKLNLERLLLECNPNLLVADASNYKSYVKNWKQICKEKGVTFHYTGTDGALLLR